MEEKIIYMKNEADTVSFGIELAKNAAPGTVIALTGDLGAGKTTLTKSIAKGLEIDDIIASPTFNIVKEYDTGRLPLYHFDVYRVGDVDEMYKIGCEEYLYGEGVCVVEWANLIEEIMPEDTLWINIEYGEKEGERIYKCTF